MRRTATSFLAMALLFGGCTSRREYPTPPRADSTPQFQQQNSTLMVPVEISLDEVRHDKIQVTGAGLFMPVIVTGQGQIAYAPRMAKR